MPRGSRENEACGARYATYPGDGFLLDMGLNLTGAKTRLRELQYWKWLDDRTRELALVQVAVAR